MEAGATFRRRDVELQAVAFHHDLEDAVVRTTTVEGKFRRVNRDAIRSTGVELLLAATVGPARLLGDLMLQRVDVEDRIAGVEREAEHMPELRGGLDVDMPLLAGVRGLGSAHYTGDQFCVHPDLDTEVTLDGTTRVDVGASRSFRLGSGPWRELRARVSMDNVTDAAVYDQCGMPQPGRTLRVGVELRP